MNEGHPELHLDLDPNPNPNSDPKPGKMQGKQTKSIQKIGRGRKKERKKELHNT